MDRVIVCGSFDTISSSNLRLLEEASQFGPVHVLLWSDRSLAEVPGQPPKCPQDERLYAVGAVRYVDRVTVADCPQQGVRFPLEYARPGLTWVVAPHCDEPENGPWCDAHGIAYHPVSATALTTISDDSRNWSDEGSNAKKVLVTGCFDWFHSGHVRFFEEVSQLGDLYVVVGHDANIELLKGKGHPMFPEGKRRYIVGSIRYVRQAFVSTGTGWMDAEPEVARIRPDIYAVNEDGDRPEKQEFCDAHGIEYRVLKREPKEGLPRRESTDLRGF